MCVDWLRTLRNKTMDKINILNKQGMLSTEDRKENFSHMCDYVTFETCLDLSKPVKVNPMGMDNRVTIENYTRDISSFISYWNYFVKKDLNGFQGFSGVRFDTSNIEIINQSK